MSERYSKEEVLNILIKQGNFDTNKISDGFHSFKELYDHRIALFLKLCDVLYGEDLGDPVWKSRFHSDGSNIEGWFIMGIGKEPGRQITYHIPMDYWKIAAGERLDHAPEWDGHTSADVVERIGQLY